MTRVPSKVATITHRVQTLRPARRFRRVNPGTMAQKLNSYQPVVVRNPVPVLWVTL